MLLSLVTHLYELYATGVLSDNKEDVLMNNVLYLDIPLVEKIRGVNLPCTCVFIGILARFYSSAERCPFKIQVLKA